MNIVYYYLSLTRRQHNENSAEKTLLKSVDKELRISYSKKVAENDEMNFEN